MSDFDPLDAYTRGLQGARRDPRADEVFADFVMRYGGDPSGANVAYDWGLENAGAGRLTLSYQALEQVFPGCFPGAAQLWGDCVGHACAHAIGGSLACEIVSGKPDEVSGKIEGTPDLPRLGVEQFPVAPESLFAFRGFAGDGWVCSEAAKVACEKGFLVRKPYPQLKIDLTEYNERTIRLGGAVPPGANWLAESKQHVARTATFLKGREQVRDFLSAGYFAFNCSGLGFSKARDEFGVCRQVGSWAHAQCFCAYDDRPETHKKFGQALVCWWNSWGRYLSGPRVIWNTPGLEIPEGCYWALADTIDRCGSIIALSSVAGWPRRQLTTYGADGNV